MGLEAPGGETFGGDGGRDDGDHELAGVGGRNGGGDQAAVGGVIVGEVGDSQVLSVEPGGGRAEQLVAGRRAGAASTGVVGTGPGQYGRGGETVGVAARTGAGLRGGGRGMLGEARAVTGSAAVGLGVAAGRGGRVRLTGFADQAGAAADVSILVVAAGSEHEKRCGHGKGLQERGNRADASADA